jgi:hypothetical protein
VRLSVLDDLDDPGRGVQRGGGPARRLVDVDAGWIGNVGLVVRAGP